MNNSYLWTSLLLPSLLQAGCSDAVGSEGERTGTLQAALGRNGSAQQSDLRSNHDVASIRYVVVRKGQACTDKPVAETTVALESESLPTSLLPDGGGPQHSFGDALMVLAAGQYTVCATPLTASGKPSAECGTSSTSALVAEGVTTEIVMVSQCKGSSNGAVDAITVLNSPPAIDNLIITPSKFITLCESARLTVEASDPDGDALSFLWQLLGTNMSSTNQTINFRSLDPVTSQLRITVTDTFGARTSLTVPMHVSPCADAGTD